MKRILFAIFLILTFAVSYVYAVDVNSWSGESIPEGDNVSFPQKEVSLTLNGTKRVVVGFSSSDVSLGETKIGAFDEVTPLDSVELTLDAKGHASIDENFYIFYQFITDQNVEIFLYTAGPLKGENNENNTVDFKLYRTHSEGGETVFINTAEDIGEDSSNLKEHVYQHPNGRYAWGDGLQLHIKTDQNQSFFDLPADQYSTTIYALVKSGG